MIVFNICYVFKPSWVVFCHTSYPSPKVQGLKPKSYEGQYWASVLWTNLVYRFLCHMSSIPFGIFHAPTVAPQSLQAKHMSLGIAVCHN